MTRQDETVPERFRRRFPGGTANTRRAERGSCPRGVSCRRMPREPRAADGDRQQACTRGRRRRGKRFSGTCSRGDARGTPAADRRPFFFFFFETGGCPENVETRQAERRRSRSTRSPLRFLETLVGSSRRFESLLAKKNGSSVDRRESREREKTPVKREASVGVRRVRRDPSAASSAWTCVYVLPAPAAGRTAERRMTWRGGWRRRRGAANNAKSAPFSPRREIVRFVTSRRRSGGRARRVCSSRA